MFPPDLFSSTEFWTAVIVALLGGGGVGAIIGEISSRRKDTAQIAAQACDILTDSVDRKSTRLNSSHSDRSRMPSSA